MNGWAEMAVALPPVFSEWFAARGWMPRRHQLAMLAAADAGESVLLIAPTGGGKTLAGFLPSLVDLHLQPREGLHTLYVSPLKALATDIARNLMTPVQEMGLAVRIETRTGDTPANRRARQRATPPQILLTTPESLAVLLSLPDAAQMFAGLTTVVMDEVHFLADRMRGAVWEEVILHLPEEVRLVSLSATVSNAEEFGGWIQTVRGDTTVVVDEQRPVPLWQHMMVGKRLFDLFDYSSGGGPDDAGRGSLVNPELLRHITNRREADRLLDAAPHGRGRGSRIEALGSRGRAGDACAPR